MADQRIITDRAGLVVLPVGTELLDKDGYLLIKVDDQEWALDHPHGDVIYLDTDEIMGVYSGEPGNFLPAIVQNRAQKHPLAVLAEIERAESARASALATAYEEAEVRGDYYSADEMASDFNEDRATDLDVVLDALRRAVGR